MSTSSTSASSVLRVLAMIMGSTHHAAVADVVFHNGSHGLCMSESTDTVSAMVNAYYHMQLSVTLRAEVPENEIAELRWHLGSGPRPQSLLALSDEVNVFLRGPAYRRGSDPDLMVDLSSGVDGKLVLTAWQEPAPDEVDRLEALFCWLAARADATASNDNGSVCVGRLRFSDEPEWTNTIVVRSGDRVAYPRIPGPPASKLLPDGDSEVTTWDDFAARLSVTLMRLCEGECITLDTDGEGFVQFLGWSSDEVIGHVSLGKDPLRLPDGEAAMRELGWHEPDNLFDWHRRIQRPVSGDEYQGAAAATVSALRGVLDVRSPQQLALSSFSNNFGEEPDVSAMGMTPTPRQVEGYPHAD
ncbi:hypothetical protein ACFXHA_05225 [Nocardia sp. NPDC059240]|uniref:TY-Chap domain-containing protein n=1 Tax=Nocardia sp. NPDC059240 TaxID=3346786 RepID=UPI0036C801D3